MKGLFGLKIGRLDVFAVSWPTRTWYFQKAPGEVIIRSGRIETHASYQRRNHNGQGGSTIPPQTAAGD